MRDTEPLLHVDCFHQTYMTELIQSRSKMTDKDDPKHDLFSNLLSANEKDLDGSGRLADNELMGMSRYVHLHRDSILTVHYCR